MSRLTRVLAIARWEFRRFYKIKEQVVTLVIMIGVAGAIWAYTSFAGREPGTVTIQVLPPTAIAGSQEVDAIAGDAGAPRLPPAAGRFRFVPGEGTEASLRNAVADGDADALLLIAESDEPTLFVRDRPGWLSDLTAVLTTASQESRLSAAGLSPETMARIVAPVDLRVEYADAPPPSRSIADGIAAGGMVFLMLFGIFTGSAYLFVAITGEKQMRVTEQVISTASPQQWIDGKILGLSAVTFATLGTYILGLAAILGVPRVFGGGLPMEISFQVSTTLLAVAVLAVLGFFLWFTFIAAVSATIDDPNNSNRSALIMLPALPAGLALLGFRDPDAPAVVVAAILPPTAPVVMPVRLIMGDTAAWEFPVAVALLLGSIWLLRRAAGTIFAASILMYGKQPSWREMWRWIRRA